MHGIRYGQHQLMLQGCDPGASSLPPLQQPQEIFSASAPGPYAAHFPGMPSLPGDGTGSYQPIVIPGVLQRRSLSSASTDDKWRSIASADALRLGAGLGNIRISQSPGHSSWERGAPPLTPSSASKRKSGEMSPERDGGFGRWAGAAPLRKMRTETPEMSPASIVGFGNGAHFGRGLASSSIASQASLQLEIDRAPPPLPLSSCLIRETLPACHPNGNHVPLIRSTPSHLSGVRL